MQTSKKNFDSPTAFLDLLFNVMLLFSVLFLISFLLINPVKKDNTMEAKAEFIITFEWDPESRDDVDAYVRDPIGNIVFFRAREVGLLHLDRDDLGRQNDTVMAPDGSIIQVKQNREIISIRGIVSGEYIVNAHMYRMHSDSFGNTEEDNELRTVKTTIRLDKINPVFRTVTQKTVELMRTGDEKTAFRFTVGRDGKVIEMNDLEYKIATRPINNQTSTEGR